MPKRKLQLLVDPNKCLDIFGALNLLVSSQPLSLREQELLANLIKNRARVLESLNLLVSPIVMVHVLPGGIMPRRMTPGAIGYDVGLRALVSPWDMEEETPHLRKKIVRL